MLAGASARVRQPVQDALNATGTAQDSVQDGHPRGRELCAGALLLLLPKRRSLRLLLLLLPPLRALTLQGM